MRAFIPALLFAFVLSLAPHADAQVTLDTLLSEQVDRAAITHFPDPAYTCKQFSSYDRASTSAADQKTWFANADQGQYLRVENTAGRDEYVMMDIVGPGAIVRIWSPDPKGTLRIYLDNSSIPAIEGPMIDLLSGKGSIGGVAIESPLSDAQSKGWNLYLPIPYATHCKVTGDAKPFYYQVNYRTYAAGTGVKTFTAAALAAAKDKLASTQRALAESAGPKVALPSQTRVIAPGKSLTSDETGAGAITLLGVRIDAANDAEREAALRATVLSCEFDGEQTVWCPLSDFFGSGVGVNAYRDWYREVTEKGEMISRWVMPYARSAKITFTNLSQKPVSIATAMIKSDQAWNDRSMHFHSSWRAEYPIHAYGARGTADWNYLEAKGEGVYVGDTLAVMNPVPEWWGEGDEKIYVDGETFPSHFGTGTEDYYGYGWCCPVVFTHPFHAQPRCDGNGKNNYGHTTVTRTRSLDAIPFTKSLRFDMEVWHWKECDESYAATTYWYAKPGATSNRTPSPEFAAKPIPQPPPLPPPYKIVGATEFEKMKIARKSDSLIAVPQDMEGFAKGTWSNDSHLWVQARKIGDFVEFQIPSQQRKEITVYATRSWDYGIVRFSVNGQPCDGDADLFSGERGKVVSTGPIVLGEFNPTTDGFFVLRAEIIGSNPKSLDPKYFFGLDCVLVTDP